MQKQRPELNILYLDADDDALYQALSEAAQASSAASDQRTLEVQFTEQIAQKSCFQEAAGMYVRI